MIKILHLCTISLVVLLSACSTIVPGPSGKPSQSALSPPTSLATRSTEPIAAYNRVLERFVNQRGQVDFAGLAARAEDFNAYLDFVANEPLSGFTDGSEKLAHLINAYNALSMFNVIASGFPTTHAGLAKVRFFALRKLPFAGGNITLYDLENSVIRPLGEPRVHFALNCSARACPVLPRQAFSGKDLNSQLEREAKAFFSSADNLRIEARAATVWVSEILKFYFEDFVAPGSANPSYRLIDYINRYAPTSVPLTYEVRFIPYDWTVANWLR